MVIVIESIETRQVSDDTLEIYCRLEGALPRRLTYKITSDHLSELMDGLLPLGPEFVIMTCMPVAMREGHHVVSKIPVDPVFLSNIKMYQKRMLAMPGQFSPEKWWLYEIYIGQQKSKLHEVNIKADEAPILGATDETRVGAMCSGGLDSLYTLMGVHEIDDIVFIDNMNYPNTVAALEVFKQMRPELRVHRVEVPEFRHNPQDTTVWVYLVHGLFLASAALLFSKYFTSMITSGTDRGPGFEIGSGHDVDYLWSSSQMRFFSYGNVSRFRKVEYLGQHAESDLIFKYIQLCSNAAKRESLQNCSRCWKCLYTMLLIDACGLREKATAFDFTDFERNFERDVVMMMYPLEYSFLHNMPSVIAGYEEQGNDVMLGLCKRFMDARKGKMPINLVVK